MSKVKERQWIIKSFSDIRKTYKVTLYNDGSYACSCPHWINRLNGTGKNCKHILVIIRSETDDRIIEVILPKKERIDVMYI